MRLYAFIIRIGHDHLDSFEILSRCTHPLYKLQILALHILMPLNIFVVLEGKFKHFLTSSSLRLRGLLPILFVHVETGFSLGRCRSHIAIILMNLLNVLLILLRLLLLVGPQPLDLRLKLLLPRPEAVDLRVQVLNLSRLALYLMAFLLQLSLQRFLLFAESRL